MVLDRLQPADGHDQDLVREAEGGADFFARAPAGGNGRDAVVNDLGRRAQRQQVSEVQGGGARNRGDSRGPARTPPVHERPPARLPRVAPVLGVHERVRAEDGTGHRCRAPGAAVCMDDGGAEFAESGNQPDGEPGDPKRRVATIRHRDSGAAQLVRVNSDLGRAKDCGLIAPPGKRLGQIGHHALQATGSEPGQHQGDAGAARERRNVPRSIVGRQVT